MQIRITRVREGIELPKYATAGSVAFDLAAAEDATVSAHGTTVVSTGLVIAIPPGHALLITPRSSLYIKKGLCLANHVGVIDQDYCGLTDEIRLILWNPGDTAVTVAKNERLAQAFFVPVTRAEWTEATADSPARGGIGSTGGYIT